MKKIFVLCIIMIGSFCSNAQLEEPKYTPEQLEQMKKELVVEAEKKKIDYVVNGIVVDEQGQPVNDVKLTITRTTHGSYWGSKSEDKKEIQKINGKFDVKASKINILFLEFFKHGYYVEALALTSDSPIKSKHLYTSTFKDGVLTANDIKVVMRAVGIPAKMDRIDKNLVYNEDGSGSVINLDTKDVDTIKDMSDAKSLPENCIYVYPELASDGKIATKIFKLNGDTVFTKVTLKVNNPDGGFVVFTNKKGDAYQYMKEAPETGYKNELTFEFSNESTHTYFYFKSKGKYGKGDIGYINVQYNDKRDGIKYINPRINLFYNPDGTRNLNGD